MTHQIRFIMVGGFLGAGKTTTLARLARHDQKRGLNVGVVTNDQQGEFGRRVLDIDYDIYAEGEAELGWLNASVHVGAERPFSLDDLLLDIVGRLSRELDQAEAEIAHLKIIGLSEGFFGVANLISRDHVPELSLPSHCDVREFELIVNARVATDPAVLETCVQTVVTAACLAAGAAAEFRQTQCFRPARPTPTHRFAVAE